jgi:hypothetical protein
MAFSIEPRLGEAGQMSKDVSASSIIAGLILLVISLGIYFLPTIWAKERRHHNAAAIFVVNLLFGWTLIGWAAALVWALTRPAHVTTVPDLKPDMSRAPCPYALRVESQNTTVFNIYNWFPYPLYVPSPTFWRHLSAAVLS